jgi:hypothetical protein
MRESSATESLIAALLPLEGVTLGSGRRGFGSDSLCVNGKIFAIPSSDGLVLKLPRARVAQLIASGDGTPFDGGKGRPMKEWVVLGSAAEDRWLDLAMEALSFVGAGFNES